VHLRLAHDRCSRRHPPSARRQKQGRTKDLGRRALSCPQDRPPTLAQRSSRGIRFSSCETVRLVEVDGRRMAADPPADFVTGTVERRNQVRMTSHPTRRATGATTIDLSRLAVRPSRRG
jgi:hypothetical protein